MQTKMRYLTTLLVATAATGAAIGFAPVAIANPGAASAPQGDTSGIDTPTGPGLWNGGTHAGGTGIDTGSDTAAGPPTGEAAIPLAAPESTPGPTLGAAPASG